MLLQASTDVGAGRKTLEDFAQRPPSASVPVLISAAEVHIKNGFIWPFLLACESTTVVQPA